MPITEGIKFNTPLRAKIVYVLLSGFISHNFLGSPFIPLLFKLTPKDKRANLALRLVGMSPHYFLYQWSTMYPGGMARQDILEAEKARLIHSRKEIIEQILRKYLQSQMTVLDFGCGPGYMAREAARYCKKVLAVDISCGVLACAKELNYADNISYLVNDGKGLSLIPDSSVDLIYSFAVVQHLSEKLFEIFLQEFFRILRPAGKVVCHIPINEGVSLATESQRYSIIYNYFYKIFAPPMVFRASQQVIQKIVNAGFKKPEIFDLKKICDIDDDITRQHLFVFEKL